MAKKRRGKSLPLRASPGTGTVKCPIGRTPPPRSTFGTVTLPQPVKTPPAISRLPKGVIEKIVDHLHDRPLDLQACSLVAKSWRAPSQSHLFRKIRWTSDNVPGWCEYTSPHSASLAGYATTLIMVSLMEHEKLGPIKGYFKSFRNVTSMTLRNLCFDNTVFDPDKVPVYFRHLKSGLKSLTLINASGSCGKLLFFTSFFPRLDHLTVSRPGDLVPPDPTIYLAYRPLQGTLFLRGHLNRHINLITLLSRVPAPRCHTVRLEHWGRMRVDDFNTLLKSCSKSLEILDVSACKDEHSSSLRPNFSLCPSLTEFRIELQHISDNPPSIINTLLTSPIVLSRITFVIHRKVEPEDLISYVEAWTETDIIIAHFVKKLFCRGGGKRLLLRFKAVRAIDFAQLVPYSVKQGVEVVVERGYDEEPMLPACVSCEAEHPNPN